MTQAAGGPGLELVLDNRKLIIGFILLMIVCAAFFLFGFVEGKRQAMEAQNRDQAGHVPPQGGTSQPVQQVASGTSGAESKPIEERPVREQLDWYKNVNKKSDSEKKPASKAASGSETAQGQTKKAPPASPPARPTPPPAVVAPPAAGTAYTVQVGAFRDRREADKKGAELKSKGYDYVISPTANGLFGIKVGNFSSRADAVAIQNRLRKDGFQTIIKTN